MEQRHGPAALCAVALAVALLMTPAAIHRIAFDGADSARFYRTASPVVIADTFPLAAGIAIDTGIVFWKVAHSLQIGGDRQRGRFYSADAAMAGASFCPTNAR